LSEPTWYTLPDFLMEEFPELRAEIEQEYFEYAEVVANPMPHFFLEDFLLQILRGRLGADEAARHRAGAILDQLLMSNDEDLAAAAHTSVWETIRDTPELREATWPYLGPTAREWLLR